MYNHQLIFENQAFELGMTLPANTSDTGAAGQRVDGTNGRLAITVLAANALVALADGKILTIGYTECDTVDGTYASPAVATSVATTYSGAFTASDGETLARLILPQGTLKYVKPVISTDDAAAAGAVDLILEYLGD